MMRNMAVHWRCQGMCETDCRKELKAWYERQDKTVVHSTEAQVQKDIDNLISWVFSDEFQVNYLYPKGEVSLNETNMRFVMSQRSRCARRVVFLLLARCMARQYKINYHSIAQAIGVSQKTTSKTILRLEREGVLEIKRGNRYSLGDGQFAAESNSYSVPHERGGRDERQYEIKIRDLMKDVANCYFSALVNLLPAREIEKTLVRQEREEYAAFLREPTEARK